MPEVLFLRGYVKSVIEWNYGCSNFPQGQLWRGARCSFSDFLPDHRRVCGGAIQCGAERKPACRSRSGAVNFGAGADFPTQGEDFNCGEKGACET